jgi:hypothetical protein
LLADNPSITTHYLKESDLSIFRGAIMPNLPYNRPEGRRQYLSIAKHQFHAANNHSKWLNINIERLVFDNADYGGFNHVNPQLAWSDHNGNLWGLLQNLADVGSQRQQFGYFENPNLPNHQWHGFPIIPFSQSRYSISDGLLTRWVLEGVLDQDDVPALLKKKRIR